MIAAARAPRRPTWTGGRGASTPDRERYSSPAGPSGARRRRSVDRGRARPAAAGRACWTGSRRPTGVPWIECDLADTRAAEAATRQLAEQAGGAGRGGHRRRRSTCRAGWPTCRAETWERIVAVDLLATAAVDPGRAAVPGQASRGTDRHRRLHAGRQGGQRRHRVLRGEVRRGRLHPGPRRRTRRHGRGDPADPRRHAHARSSTTATRSTSPGPDAVLNEPGRRRRRGHVRAAASRPAARSASWWSAPSRRRRTRDPRAARPRRRRPRHRRAGPARAARRAIPTEELVLAAPAWLAPLVDLVGGVDRVVPVDGLARAGWPGRPAASRSTCTGAGPQSHRLLPASRARPAARLRLPGRRAPRRPAVDRRTSTRSTAGAGCCAGTASPADRDRPGAAPAGAGPGAARGDRAAPRREVAARRWPAERFAALARALTAAGHRVVVTGSPASAAWPRGWPLGGLPDRGARGADRRRRAGRAGGPRPAGGQRGHGRGAPGHRVRHAVGAALRPVPPARWGPPPDRPWHRVLWHPELAATPAATLASAMAYAHAPGAAEGRPARRAQAAGERPHPALLADRGGRRSWRLSTRLRHGEPEHQLKATQARVRRSERTGNLRRHGLRRRPRAPTPAPTARPSWPAHRGGRHSNARSRSTRKTTSATGRPP